MRFDGQNPLLLWETIGHAVLRHAVWYHSLLEGLEEEEKRSDSDYRIRRIQKRIRLNFGQRKVSRLLPARCFAGHCDDEVEGRSIYTLRFSIVENHTRCLNEAPRPTTSPQNQAKPSVKPTTTVVAMKYAPVLTPYFSQLTPPGLRHPQCGLRILRPSNSHRLPRHQNPPHPTLRR